MLTGFVDMYVYLYDNFVRQSAFKSVIKAIEIRLTDYGLAGKIIRLNNYSDAKPIIEEEIKRGAKTIVMVGNDETFGNVLSRSAASECVFGFLPVGGNNSIATVLGIPEGVEACQVLAKRRREKLDVGLVNNRYFVSQVRVLPAKVSVVYDDLFKVSAQNLLEVVICNLKPLVFKKNPRDMVVQTVHPQDGKLEAFLRPLTKRRFWRYTFEEPSIFPFEEMHIEGTEPFQVETDGKLTKEIKLHIRLAHSRIDMIVGRERQF